MHCMTMLAGGTRVASALPLYVSAHSTCAPLAAIVDVVATVRVLRLVADVALAAACLLGCFTLARGAWKLRHRVPLALTGAALTVIMLAAMVRVALAMAQWRAAIAPSDLGMSAFISLLALLLALAGIVLQPFLRHALDFGVTAEEEHQLFVAAAETSLHGFYILQIVRSPFRGVSDFRVTFANALAEAQLGCERSRLKGLSLDDAMPYARSSGLFRRLKLVAQTGEVFNGRIKGKDAQGAELWFNVRAVRHEDNVALVMQDISDERQRQQSLQEMSRISQSIIGDAPFSIIAVNANGMITAMNAAAQVLTQYRRDELVGRHSLVLLHDAAELSQRSVEVAEEVGRPVEAGFDTLKATLGKRASNEGEWTYIRKDGRKLTVHLAMTALRDDSGQITGYLATAFDVSERKALAESVNFMAQHDSLTRLANRSLLNERLETAVEQAACTGQRVAVFAIDLDHFKRINDSLGHAGGDEVLVCAAERLQTATRTTDLIARVGGDEFVVVMPNAGELGDIQSSGARLLKSLQAPVHIAGRELSVTASIGLCTFPDLADDAATLLRNADAAMYAAKQKGRNTLHAFSESMLEASADQLELEADLRRALHNGELEIYYQPQVNTRTEEITGVEALLRWHHPVRGMVQPMRFIRAAEESGMILPIGRWVLREACKDVKRMQTEIGRRFTLAVNLSPRQMLDDNLVDLVKDSLDESGLSAGDLELEITEHTLMISTAETLNVLASLRALGVRLAVDDFGTGFSSFKYILDYKVDRLKIDRSFTSKVNSDPTAAAIVRTVIAMAHGLNMTVVAEGVETEDQLAFLMRRRCDEAQGYHFGRPVPLPQLRRMLSSAEQADAAELANMPETAPESLLGDADIAAAIS